MTTVVTVGDCDKYIVVTVVPLATLFVNCFMGFIGNWNSWLLRHSYLDWHYVLVLLLLSGILICYEMVY